MQKKQKILTLSSNDQGISWGPAIHYLELWNEVVKFEDCIVSGHVPSWTRNRPIVTPLFDLRLWRVPNISGLRQIIWDFYCFFIILFKRYDILYLRLSGFHVWTWLGVKLKRPKLAVELNGLAQADQRSAKSGVAKTWLFVFFERLLIKEAQVCFSVSDSIKSHAEIISPDAHHVHVDNGVSERFFEVRSISNSTDEKIRIIYVGTFTPWDGAEMIITLAKKFPKVEFMMIGDGGRRRCLQQEAPNNVKFLGWVPYDELPSYYAKSDAGIVLYERERHQTVTVSSLKTREYIAAGLPIFCTKVPGQELVQEYGYGIASQGAIEDDFSEFLERLSEFKQKIRKEESFRRKEFSWAAVATRTREALL